MSASTANGQNRPEHRFGPHGIDLDADRGVTRFAIKGLRSKVDAQLRACVKTEAVKQAINADRASSSSRAAQ